MEKKREVQELNTETLGIDTGRRKAMCKIAVGVGALAGLSVLPEQWTRPLIGRIVIPAHAATSGEVEEPAPEPQPQGCVLAPGCYAISGLTTSELFMGWPGGGTSEPVLASTVTSCVEGSTIAQYESVVATSMAEANEIFGTEDATYTEVFVDGLTAGCSVWVLLN